MNNLYPTGDSCIQDKEGDFYFVRRLDNEIKFHGYRINLSEIEHHLKNHTDILSCAVFLNNEKIVAFYVTYYNKFVTESLLKNYLLKSIPSYSVPQEFYNMEELPLNQHGKIDYKRLKEMILESVITKKASSI
jgi:acyl-coenzyme A synthetase/AMP-(fatty) acid ligase